MLKIQASEPALPDDGRYVLGKLRVVSVGSDGQETTYFIGNLAGLLTEEGKAVRVELEIEPAEAAR